MGLIVSYIIAGILTLIAIVLAIFAFIPTKPGDCDKDDICKMNGAQSSDCKDEIDRCNKKKPHYILLWFFTINSNWYYNCTIFKMVETLYTYK